MTAVRWFTDALFEFCLLPLVGARYLLVVAVARACRHDHLLAPICVLVHRGYSETRRHRYSALALDGRVATLSPFRDAVVARTFALLAPLSHCPVARISLRVKPYSVSPCL